MARVLVLLSAVLLLGLARPARAKVAVTVWASGLSPATLAAMATAIRHAHPNIALSVADYPSDRYAEALREAASSRLLPDIVAVAPGAETQAIRGSLIHLDPIADAVLGKDWQDDYPAALLAEAKLGNPPGDGRFYMLPMTARVDGLWLGTAAAAKAHVGSVPLTLAALGRDAARLRQAGLQPLVVDGGSGQALVRLYLQILAETDPRLVRAAAKGEAVWTRPPALTAARTWRHLFAVGIVPQAALRMSERQARAAYRDGRAGMIADSSELLALARRKPGYAVGQFFTFPAMPPSLAPAPPVGGIALGWAMTRAATGQDSVKVASSAVLHDLLVGAGAEVAVDRLAGFPAWKGLALHHPPPEQVAALHRRLRTALATALPDVIGPPAIEQALALQLRRLAERKVAPQAAMEAVNQAAQGAEEAAR